MSLGYAPGANSPRAAIRRKRHRSLSRSGSSKSGPIASGSSSGFGSSRRVPPGAASAGPARPSEKRAGEARRTPRGASIVWSSPARCVEREADRDRLQVVGLVLGRPCGSPVRSRDSKPVTCSAPASGSSAPVSVASRNQSAQTVALAVRARRSATASTGRRVTVGADRRVAQQQLQPPGRERRREHRLEHGERDARLVAEPRHRARARVQLGQAPRARRSAGSARGSARGSRRAARGRWRCSRSARSSGARRAGRPGS